MCKVDDERQSRSVGGRTMAMVVESSGNRRQMGSGCE